jgi:hypothetical protein
MACFVLSGGWMKVARIRDQSDVPAWLRYRQNGEGAAANTDLGPLRDQAQEMAVDLVRCIAGLVSGPFWVLSICVLADGPNGLLGTKEYAVLMSVAINLLQLAIRTGTDELAPSKGENLFTLPQVIGGLLGALTTAGYIIITISLVDGANGSGHEREVQFFVFSTFGHAFLQVLPIAMRQIVRRGDDGYNEYLSFVKDIGYGVTDTVTYGLLAVAISYAALGVPFADTSMIVVPNATAV